MEFAGLKVWTPSTIIDTGYCDKGFFIPVNKPAGWSSFNVVAKCRYALKRYCESKKMKVGHGGTLDPAATGMLVLAVGRKATREIEKIQLMKKTYTGQMKLGAETASFDAETPETANFPVDHISQEMVSDAVKRFIGEIDQVPPAFSALKIKGKRAYKLARQGQAVEPESRKVTVYEFRAELVARDLIRFKVVCGKGTYIRSLARDLGRALGSGAYLTALERTSIGPFRLEDSFTPEEVSAALQD